MKSRTIIRWILRLLLGICFVWAAASKFQDPLAFAAAVASYEVISGIWARGVVLVLPWLELWVGIGLMIPGLKRGSAWVVWFLLLGFIGLHLSAWWRGLNIECGCFGAMGMLSGYGMLFARNSLLLLGATILIFLEIIRHREQKAGGSH
ncbi:MAG: Uncharacterised protein [Opitutia bacterium UBA7350]|nr:MAG: Uncharacterised protein [Opitutae bacterium UBA7350]